MPDSARSNNEETRPPAAQPRRVAVMVDHLYDYQLQMLRGIQLALRDAGLASVTFVGRHLYGEHVSHVKANDLYGLIDPNEFVGMIVSAANLGRSLDDDAFRAFLEVYALPIVTVSRAVTGFPAVTVDNTSGLVQLLEHLVHVRRLSRFVYVGGTPGNHEAQVREEIVLNYLDDHGLTVSPQRILTGDFYGPKAAQEISKLLKTDRDFDVVVCANDEMAFSVMQALAQQGLRVPDDVAVVGFDDIAQARHTAPPLTTVRQPTQAMGVKAVEMLLDYIAGLHTTREEVLGSALVKRQSCGTRNFTPPMEGAYSLGETVRAAQLNALSDPGATQLFLDCLDHAVQGLDPAQAKCALITLALDMKEQVDGYTPAVRDRLAVLLSLGLDLIDRLTFDPSSAQDILARNNEVSSLLELSLTTHERLDSFQQEVQLYLRSLDVQCFALVLYDEFASSPAPFGRIACSSFGEVDAAMYPVRQLLPDTLRFQLDAGNFFVVPLYFGEVHFGLLLLEPPGADHFNIEQVRYTLSVGLQHVHTARQHQRYAQQLEQLVRERTQALEQEISIRKEAESALLSLNSELSRAASTDALTGITNRAAFNTMLDEEWRRHRLAGLPLSILLCDVDLFKQYNDHYGHLAGDECLRRVAAAIKSSGRAGCDNTARFGGEEFVMLLPGTDTAGAIVVAERLVTSVSQLGLTHERSDVAGHVTISVGLASCIPSDACSVTLLLNQADQALYSAKQLGRNRWVEWRHANCAQTVV